MRWLGFSCLCLILGRDAAGQGAPVAQLISPPFHEVVRADAPVSARDILGITETSSAGNRTS